MPRSLGLLSALIVAVALPARGVALAPAKAPTRTFARVASATASSTPAAPVTCCRFLLRAAGRSAAGQHRYVPAFMRHSTSSQHLFVFTHAMRSAGTSRAFVAFDDPRRIDARALAETHANEEQADSPQRGLWASLLRWFGDGR